MLKKRNSVLYMYISYTFSGILFKRLVCFAAGPQQCISNITHTVHLALTGSWGYCFPLSSLNLNGMTFHSHSSYNEERYVDVLGMEKWQQSPQSGLCLRWLFQCTFLAPLFEHCLPDEVPSRGTKIVWNVILYRDESVPVFFPHLY